LEDNKEVDSEEEEDEENKEEGNDVDDQETYFQQAQEMPCFSEDENNDDLDFVRSSVSPPVCMCDDWDVFTDGLPSLTKTTVIFY